ncbi:MAG TPA: hypothetical protein VFV96_08970 [Verrucomicrobiae bacterium]|nr:hypothetical protein [Verrucomicrobiae bacterium]
MPERWRATRRRTGVFLLAADRAVVLAGLVRGWFAFARAAAGRREARVTPREAVLVFRERTTLRAGADFFAFMF